MAASVVPRQCAKFWKRATANCAAGAGNVNMISCLVALASDSDGGETAETVPFLRRQNYRGETALHQTVRAAPKNKMACVCKLMSVDPDLARIPSEDYATSALYLAIWLGEMEVARHLLHKTDGKLSYSGPHGQNVFHAAVHRGTDGGGRGERDDAEAALGMLLGQTFINSGQGEERQQQQDMMTMRTTRRGPLLSQLLNQRDKEAGLNPLCLAVSLSATTAKTVRLLLDANVSAAYQPDRNGSYPIHVAASGDCPDFVTILLHKCPDCATLRDGKGRTFLHVAVNQKNYRVVEFAVNVRPQLSILSAQDDDGDTALHRAVQVGDLDIFNCLIRNPQVRPDVPNAQGLTPLRLARTLKSASVIQNSLESLVGAPRSLVPDTREDWEKSQDLSQATQVMGTVSVLVATVTFASAFTLPGGYRSADGANDDTHGAAAAAGTPLLAGSYAFDAFILADTLAFVCSSMATFSLLFSGMPYMDLSVHRFFHASFRLMKGAGEILLAAFALALYLVLAPVAHATAIIVCIIALGHV